MTTTFDVLKLPTELLTLTLSYLNFRDLLRCSQVCKPFKHIVDNYSLLQYIIELAAAHRVPNENGQLPGTSRLLANLREEYEVYSAPSITLDHVESLTVNGTSWEWEYRGGVFSRIDMTRTVVDVIQLDAIDDTRPTWRWSSAQPFRTFIADPAADVFFGRIDSLDLPHLGPIDIHIFSLSCGKFHPDAKYPILSLHEAKWIGRDDIFFDNMQVHEDLLVILYRKTDVVESAPIGRNQSLIVINWKMGVTLKILDLTKGEVGLSCCLIDSQTFLLGGSIRDSTSTIPVVHVYDLSSPGMQTEAPTANPAPAATFTFPAMTADPFPYYGEPSFRFCPSTDRSRVYPMSSYQSCHTTPPDIKLIGVQVFSKTGEAFMFFVHAATFTNYLRFALMREKGNNGSLVADKDPQSVKLMDPIIVPWAKWGQDHTRCLTICCGMRSVYGWRVGYRDRLLDFNPLAISRELNRTTNCAQPAPQTLVLAPTIVPAGDSFISEVITALPYRETRFKLAMVPGPNRVLLDEDIVLYQDGGTEREYLHVFALC